MNCPARKTYVLAFALILCLSLYALVPRWHTEAMNRSAAIVMDYQDLLRLAERSDVDMRQAVSEYISAGLRGFMIGELTGNDLENGMIPVSYSLLSASEYPGLFKNGDGWRALLVIPSSWWAHEAADTYIMTKMKDTERIMEGERTFYLLPFGPSALRTSGIIPDFDGLRFAQLSGIPVIYRPAPSPCIDSGDILNSLETVLNGFGNIKCLAPSGEIVASYPELEGLGNLIRNRKLALAQVEFSRQIGASKLAWLSYPNLLPLHSVTEEEILSRRISKQVLFERMLRAARERSVRILVMRPSVLNSTGSAVDGLKDEIGHLSAGLEDNGISDAWPEFGTAGRKALPGSLALSLLFLLLLSSLWRRIFEYRCFRKSSAGIICFLIFVPLLGFVILKVSFIARMVGAFSAGFLASEAALIALEGWRRPFRSVVAGFIVALTGGLALAAFFSSPVYMLRLASFSGVKLTLLLPIVIVLFHDLKRRVHPESLGEILRRPPLWGELLLIGLFLSGAVLVLFRSGNVQMVPGLEIRIRDMLEHLLVARPRSKELFAGYPALMLWYFFRRRDIWQHYREIFRLGATLAFSSVVNSFCHFHTRLYFIILREFNGLWTGVFAGCIAVGIFVVVLMPLWKKIRGAVLD